MGASNNSCMELSMRLEAESAEHARSIHKLTETLQNECDTRAQEIRQFGITFHKLTETLQNECDTRAQEIRQLANTLQTECNTRAAEVEDIAKALKSDRDARMMTSMDSEISKYLGPILKEE